MGNELTSFAPGILPLKPEIISQTINQDGGLLDNAFRLWPERLRQLATTLMFDRSIFFRRIEDVLVPDAYLQGFRNFYIAACEQARAAGVAMPKISKYDAGSIDLSELQKGGADVELMADFFGLQESMGESGRQAWTNLDIALAASFDPLSATVKTLHNEAVDHFLNTRSDAGVVYERIQEVGILGFNQSLSEFNNGESGFVAAMEQRWEMEPRERANSEFVGAMDMRNLIITAIHW